MNPSWHTVMQVLNSLVAQRRMKRPFLIRSIFCDRIPSTNALTFARLRIFFKFTCAYTMKAFMGRLTCGFVLWLPLTRSGKGSTLQSHPSRTLFTALDIAVFSPGSPSTATTPFGNDFGSMLACQNLAATSNVSAKLAQYTLSKCERQYICNQYN